MKIIKSFFIFIIYLLATSATCLYAQDDDVVKEVPFTPIYGYPAPPGGESELCRFIQNNIKYPTTSCEKGVDGKVTAYFQVKRSGEIGNIGIINGLDSLCNAEVVRVLRMMHKWIPAKSNTKACTSLVIIPIYFKLHGDTLFEVDQSVPTYPTKEIQYIQPIVVTCMPSYNKKGRESRR